MAPSHLYERGRNVCIGTLPARCGVNYWVIKNWVELISFTYMVKLEATASLHLPSFSHFVIPSVLDLAGSCCISMWLCLRPFWGCFCFTKYCIFPNHTVSVMINWLNEITLSLPVEQTRLSLSVLCPCKIFFFPISRFHRPSCYTHTCKFSHQSCSEFSFIFAFRIHP